MAAPVKIALAALGSGAVAVGGYEAVSYVSGKDGLFVSGASNDASVNISPTNNEQQNTSNPVDNKKKKISDLIATTDFKCTIKVWINNEDKNVNDVEEEELNGLFEHLDGIKSTTCGTDVSLDKLLVLKKGDNNSWSEINETDRVKELAKSWSSKCTVKVRSMSDGSFEYKNVIENLGSGVTLDGLYEKVKDLKTECLNGNPQKTIIFKVDSSQWIRMTDKDQIEDLVGNVSFKCVIKVKTSGNADDWKNVVTETNELKKLLEFLTSIEESYCGSSIDGENKKELILLKLANSGTITFLTDKQQIDSWVTEKKGICSLKIRDSSGNRDIEEKDDLSGLIDFLKKDPVTAVCGFSSVSSPLAIVVQKDNSTWTIYPTIDQVKSVKAKLDEKCTVNIKDNNDQTKAIDNNLKQESLSNLLKQLESAYETHCKNAEANKKPTINIKLTTAEGNEWTTTHQAATG